MAKQVFDPELFRQKAVQMGYTADEVDAALERNGVKPSVMSKIVGGAKSFAESPIPTYAGGAVGAVGGGMIGGPAGVGLGWLGGKMGMTAAQEGLKMILNAYGGAGGKTEQNKNPIGTTAQSAAEGSALEGIIALGQYISALRSAGVNIEKLIGQTKGGPSKEQVESKLGNLDLKKFNLSTGQPDIQINPSLYQGGTLSPSDVSNIKPLAQKEVGAVLTRYPIPGATDVGSSGQPTTPTWQDIHGFQRNAQSQANYARAGTNKPVEQYWKNMQTAYSNMIKEGIPGTSQLYKQYEEGQRLGETVKKVAPRLGLTIAGYAAYNLIRNLFQSQK